MEGRLFLPSLGIDSDISWCVDTGADRSLLLPSDAIRMGIDFTALSGETESVGVGGISRDYVESAVLAFSEAKRGVYVYMIDLLISTPSPEIMDLPSLLGRDILHRWRMSYNFTRKSLLFEVLSADVVLPLEGGT